MKRKRITELKYFPSVTLFEEDFNDLLEMFKGNTSSFSISDHEFEYEDAKELKAKRGPIIARLSIDSFAPSLIFKINKFSTQVFHDGNIMSGPGFIEIARLLKTRRRWIMYALINPITAIAVVALWIVLGIIYPSPWKAIKAIPIMVVGSALIAISLINQSGGFSKVVLASRFDE